MRLTIAIFAFLGLSGTSCIYAEMSNSTPGTSNPVTRKLFIDPSSTSVRLGKATLIVGPLTRRGGNYIGDYQLKVRPYFFKSETGTLVLGASEDFVRRLQSGRAIDFTGKALTREDGTTHVVLGRATPLSGDRGTVTFSIHQGEKRKDHFQDFVSFRDLDRTDRTHFSLICGAPTARLSPAPAPGMRLAVRQNGRCSGDLRDGRRSSPASHHG